MNKQLLLQAEHYLNRFDAILAEMANRMLSQDITNNITIHFIKCMIPHHQAAIYMCQNLLRYTSYEPLQKIAQNIITTQSKGIKQMDMILRTTSHYENSMEDVNTYMDRYFEIVYQMLDEMQNSLRSINIDLDFISEMIPHHEGAISMCENLLQYQIDPRLEVVAKNIIQEQSMGVLALKEVERRLSNPNDDVTRRI